MNSPSRIYGSGDRERVREWLQRQLQTAYAVKVAHLEGSRKLEARVVQERIDVLLEMWSAFLGTETPPKGNVFADLVEQQTDRRHEQ